MPAKQNKGQKTSQCIHINNIYTFLSHLHISREMYLVCSCWREFGSEMKNLTLNIKKNGAEPEEITVGKRAEDIVKGKGPTT